MDNIAGIAGFCIFSYLLGSVPFGLVLTKLVKGIDVREVGSGNIGATNVARAAGPGLGLLVFFFDFLKGALPVYLSNHILESARASCAVGFCAILGHTFPVYLRFQGGKGVATTFGVLFFLSRKTFFTLLGSWGIFFFLSGYVSVASILSAVLTPFYLQFNHWDTEHYLFGFLAAALIIYRHKENINRLFEGKESKVLWKS